MSSLRMIRPTWKDREHLFNPANITKYEFILARAKGFRAQTAPHIVPKPLPDGPVIERCAICLRNQVVTPFICAECKGTTISVREEDN
jgi:hypothetical protein